jgi:hypothetical protein
LFFVLSCPLFFAFHCFLVFYYVFNFLYFSPSSVCFLCLFCSFVVLRFKIFFHICTDVFVFFLSFQFIQSPLYNMILLDSFHLIFFCSVMYLSPLTLLLLHFFLSSSFLLLPSIFCALSDSVLFITKFFLFSAFFSSFSRHFVFLC